MITRILPTLKAKIKPLITKKLLQEQPFYKQLIKKTRIKKLSNQELLRELPFIMILIFQETKGHLEDMLKPIKKKILIIEI